jgi:hypothetical protein
MENRPGSERHQLSECKNLQYTLPIGQYIDRQFVYAAGKDYTAQSAVSYLSDGQDGV